ncbi:MAG: DUF190 domain-containing protein [Planctomycetes bacterium]|nr:DUF190 domain-containing protein [Planctomycetota bacterium]
MKQEKNDQVLMRIFLSETDKHNGKVIYHMLLQLLHDEKIAGATVIKGVTGFGAKSRMHTANLLSLAQNLPIIVEAVDSKENIDKVLPKIEQFVDDGLITFQDVKAIRYSKD